MPQSNAPPMASAIRAYWLPLTLFSAAMFYQLFVIPKSFPPSHYDVLGIKMHSPIEEVKEAYEKLSSNWNSGEDIPDTTDFIKIRYAFELLTNTLWKRDYDLFGIDEQLHVIETLKGLYVGKSFSEIDLPLLNAPSSDAGEYAFNVINSKDFESMFIDTTKAWLVQVYSMGSNRCEQFSQNWKRIAALLDGIANSGMVELGDVQLAMYLAEKKSTGRPFFRNDLPSVIAFPPGCQTLDCLVRYDGELSVDAVTDWFATTILGLPRIFYYSKESLGPNFLAKSAPHKVKVILFSETGERASPVIRQAARNYSAHASFAFVLWRKEEFSVWWTTFEVESAPAVVFLKDPGVKPIVHQGSFDNSSFLEIMEQNKQQELPQLRSVTSMELGCDPRGYSRAGKDTMIWYCVILAGRLSTELNTMRETMRRVHEVLSSNDVLTGADQDALSAPSAVALQEKRLTFAWLDGEVQKAYCFFYIHSESSYETCGPRRDLTDVPQLFIVRYKRNDTEDTMKIKRKPKSILDAFREEDVDPASQLVARFNGSGETSQIIQWISHIIEDGDSRDLPFFRTKTPELIPEDADPVWTRGTRSILVRSQGLKQSIRSNLIAIYDRLGDPRIGPVLLLGALLSFGSIWLQRSQSTRPTPSNLSNQPSTMDKARAERKKRSRPVSDKDKPPSITDMEPKDAHQMPLLDSDSD